MPVYLKRAYSPPSADDGYRVLVDRLWPRGVSKVDIRLDEWLKIIAPSDTLRKLFHGGAITWSDFKRRYATELKAHENELRRLALIARERNLTIVYGAHDQEKNHAVIVQQSLRKLGAPSK